MSKVITYSSSRDRIDITLHQERLLRQSHTWPKDRAGQEMVDVHHGLHSGKPTYSDDELCARYGI